MSDELWRCDALELGRLIATKAVSSREVVQAHLGRIDAINGSLNAVIRRLDAEALDAADRADAATRSGSPAGPLHGVPVTLKENMDVEGLPTTHGSVVLAEAIAAVDEPVVARLKAAGAIPLARTNLPDMAMRLHTDSGLHGATLNPWDHSVTPGGSSGGEAVCLATGMSPLGIGGDMCGSLRWPSQCCGVATLKPTLGAVPRVVVPGLPYGIELLAVLGPLARSIDDLNAAFSVMAGADRRDPWSVPADFGDGAGPQRVMVATDPGGTGTDPDVRAAIERAAGAFEAAGWQIEPGEPPRLEEASQLWPELNFGNPTDIAPMTALLSPDAANALGQWAVAAEVAPDASTFVDALHRRTGLMRDWADFFDTGGLWLTATSTEQPFPVGADLAGVERVSQILHGHRVIMATNSLGLPSVTMPVGAANGLPQSVQIVGPRFSERRCLGAARVIEQAIPPLTPIDP